MQRENRSNLKILVLSFPYWGHSNPLGGIVHQLTSTYGNRVHVIVYATEKTRSYIESTGAEYRAYPHYYYPPIVGLRMDKEANMRLDLNINFLIDIAEKNVPQLCTIINDEKPDLVLFDETALFALYAIARLKKNAIADANAAKPMYVMLSTAFTRNYKEIYPNKVEDELEAVDLINSDMASVERNHASLCDTLGLDRTPNDGLMSFLDSFQHSVNIVTMFPELMPRSHLFDKKTTHFVGACLVEPLRQQENNCDAQLRSLLTDSSASMKLIYVSFGTVFNDRISVYEKTFAAIRILNENSKTADFQVIVSVGAQLATLNDLIAQHRMEPLPSNVLLVEYAPQLEILRRASVFVSHCGMNSASESLHYGVPLVCIPLDVDQLQVAYRVADELGAGIRLDHRTMTAPTVAQAIIDLLSDEDYSDRVKRLSVLSHKHNGVVNAANILMKLAEEHAHTQEHSH